MGDPAIGYVVKYISSAGPPTEPPTGARELVTNDTNVTLAENLAENKRRSYRYYVWVAARSAGVTGEYSERESADTLSSKLNGIQSARKLLLVCLSIHIKAPLGDTIIIIMI